MCRHDYVTGVRQDDEEDRNSDEQQWQQGEAHRRQLEDEARMQRAEEAQRRQEEYEEQQYEEQQLYEPTHHYSFYQDLNRQFNGNYLQAVHEAARIWKDFAGLDQSTQDGIYEKVERATINGKHYIYTQLRREMRGNEDRILQMFDSSFDVCRVVYLSKIISRPDDQEAYERITEFEEWVDEEVELDNWW